MAAKKMSTPAPLEALFSMDAAPALPTVPAKAPRKARKAPAPKLALAVDFEALGRSAFLAGKSMVPHLDDVLRAALVGLEVGQGDKALRAWVAGWHRANLEAPLPPKKEAAPKAPKKAPAAPKVPAKPKAPRKAKKAPAVDVGPELAPAVKVTREEWLERMTKDHLADLFAKAGGKLPPKIRMSCGWPSSRAMASKSGRVLGQCWRPEASSDGHFEIFITPALEDVTDVVGVLIHELVHTCMPIKEGHGKLFRELAIGVGLTGKMTATIPTDWLKVWIADAVAKVGPYPHAKLDMSQKKVQTTRLLKVICVNLECDFLAEEEKPYTVRMSGGVFDAGKPCCGVCRDRMEIAPDTKPKAAPKAPATEEG